MWILLFENNDIVDSGSSTISQKLVKRLNNVQLSWERQQIIMPSLSPRNNDKTYFCFSIQLINQTYPKKQDCAIKDGTCFAKVTRHMLCFIHNDLTSSPMEISNETYIWFAEVFVQLWSFLQTHVSTNPSMTKIDIHSFGLWPTTTTTMMMTTERKIDRWFWKLNGSIH